LGFQIPPIFCISQLARLGSSLKKNPKFFFGFSDPANFLHQPATRPNPNSF
jgi:muramoyltetrapeptide carboxypeptidase LdcA involved in peptidoglycan recycling